MAHPDWLVIGGGITGAALAYELTRQNFAVTLLDPEETEPTATDCSYGGLAYWAGTTPLTRQLCQEGIAQYHTLHQELDGATGFRATHLLLTITPDRDPTTIAEGYGRFTETPEILQPTEAQKLEPRLNPDAIAATLKLPHAHIDPAQTTQAYLQAFERLGGKRVRDRVTHWLQDGDRITGVQTSTQTYESDRVVLCAGGWSRGLLAQLDVYPKIYFTHAEILEGIAPPGTFNGVIMPAQLQRFALEQTATQPEKESLWRQPGQEITPHILDLGGVQFADGRVRIGQISRTLSDPEAHIDEQNSARQLRDAAGQLFPKLDTTEFRWRHCLVSFPSQPLPPIGEIPARSRLYLFNGFSNTLVFTPPLARHFAAWAVGADDPVMRELVAE